MNKIREEFTHEKIKEKIKSAEDLFISGIVALELCGFHTIKAIDLLNEYNPNYNIEVRMTIKDTEKKRRCEEKLANHIIKHRDIFPSMFDE